MKSSGLVRRNTANQGTATSGVCLGQDILKSALFTQAMRKPIGKTQAKAHTQSMKMPAFPYSGKRYVVTIRMTPPDIRVSARFQVDTIIGSVQKILKRTLSDERRVSPAVAVLPSTVKSPSLFGGQPFVALNPFQSALQRPDNESLRMNPTATQVLYSGNCGGGCPVGRVSRIGHSHRCSAQGYERQTPGGQRHVV